MHAAASRLPLGIAGPAHRSYLNCCLQLAVRRPRISEIQEQLGRSQGGCTGRCERRSGGRARVIPLLKVSVMHPLQLAQAAAILSAMGRQVATGSFELAKESAYSYWLAQRFRCDTWHHAISAHRENISHCGTSRRMQLWHALQPTLQEILASEPLVRVVAYLAAVAEARGRDADWAPLTHGALACQMEARQRCLNLIVFGYGLPVEQAVRLNRLRQLLEEFSDQLIGLMPDCAALPDYVFDVARVRMRQLETTRWSVRSRLSAFAHQTLSNQLAAQLTSDWEIPPANGRLNEEVLRCALAMFPAECFDSWGLPCGPQHQLARVPQEDRQANACDLSRPITAPFTWLAAPERPSRQSSRHREQD
jgi:hypothetical protein